MEDWIFSPKHCEIFGHYQENPSYCTISHIDSDNSIYLCSEIKFKNN